ncbi:MAG: D-alanyl-D-alanine carboxypeptidase family protein [Pseudomonadota bacterium]
MLLVNAPENAHAKTNHKYASLVMDADTGTIISERYGTKKLHPASLTKMMTLLMVFEALDRGDIRKKDRIRVSRYAASMVPSKLYLKAGSTIKVEDAIYALVTKSANDVATAVAEHIGGTESRFANLMTSRARTIGMYNTRFKNASGLHHRQQITTARDMATLARYILQRYPHHYRYFSTKNFTYKGKSYRNHNRLMTTYKGMDGFKTGYINASGFNLVASARRDGRRLIGVVFGGRSSKTRNAHMADIMSAGFRKAKNIRFAYATVPPPPPAKPIQVALNKNNVGQPSYTNVAALNQVEPRSNHNVQPNYTALSAALQEGRFGEMMGQGDSDQQATSRIETGLLAVSVHRGDYRTQQEVRTLSGNPPNLNHPRETIGKWSIQIGAFNSRVATDDALRQAVQKLPSEYKNAKALSVPLNTADGTIFRARLGGMTQQEAFRACTYFNDCMPVAPQSIKVNTQ